uniref:Signal recognition particle subunit SRP72 n=1 Tax=Fagus sylvatica TaxID=28930 RepID=A0A2N9FTF9_FAGSY
MAPKPKDKPKPSPSPSQPPPSIEDLFSSLSKHIQRSDFAQAAKLSDQVLAIAPGDEDAIRCKVVALIKDDKIEDALSTIQSSQNVPIDFNFLKAYCLYRQNRLNEALEYLESQEKNSATMLLESQILFRMGKLDACVDIYQKLQKSKIVSLEINSVAALVAAGRASEVQGTLEALRVKATSNFEVAYNTACALIERNKYTDAEQLLLSGRRIGQETLMEEENWPDDDIEIELAPLAVQLAYLQQKVMQINFIHQLLGHSQEAIEAYTDIINRDLADELSLAVTVNNLIALKGPKDVSDSLRKLDRLKEKDSQKFQLAHGIDLKISPKQREAVYANRVLLLLHANRLDQARELVSALSDMFADSVMPVLLQAAVFSRAQVAAAAGHPHIAAETLVEILRMRAGDIDGCSCLCLTLQSDGAERHGHEEDAARLYEELVKTHGKHGSIGLGWGWDVDSLEKTSGAKHVDGASHVGVTEALEEGKSKAKAKKKRKRKPRYPKGFDPANPGPPPDPERWLPKRERSSYRPKRKDKRAAQVRGSQGAVVREKHEAGTSGASSNVSNLKSNQVSTSPKGTSHNAAAEPTKPSSKSSQKEV